MTTDNRGISISGGNVTVGAMAAGANARATSVNQETPTSVAEIRDQLAEIVRLLQTGSIAIADRDSVITTAHEAQRELEAPHPDKRSVLALLQRLAVGAGSAASIAGAVTAIQHAVQILL